MKKKFLWIIIIPIILFGLLASIFCFPMLDNDLALSSFYRQLYNCPLPEKTSLIDKTNECGLLIGNGNHMDFLAIIKIETNLSKKEIEKYYSSKSFKRAKSDDKIKAEIYTDNDVKNNKFETPYISRDDFYNTSIENDVYYVQIFDPGYDSGFDLRGH